MTRHTVHCAITASIENSKNQGKGVFLSLGGNNMVNLIFFRVGSEVLVFCGKLVKNLKTLGTYQFTKIVENDSLGLF